jgi:DNA-binding MarR family transcriptional regulator
MEWHQSLGLANAKHLSKLLIAQRNGYCSPHASLDERLAMIAGELDPESFYNGRLGDAIAVPRYRFAHELMTLRIVSQPQMLAKLIDKMKVRASLTHTAVSKLLKAHEIRRYPAKTGEVVEITELGRERLRNLYGAWEELGSKYCTAIPSSPDYCPETYRQKSVN